MIVYLAATSDKQFCPIHETRYALESFFYFQDWQVSYLKAWKSFMLDSGAFTFINSSKSAKIDWDAYVESYAAFINKHDIKLFFGRYYFAYIPNPKGRILGLSKIARVVDFHAAKMQIQERLVSDVVKEIEAALGSEYPPLGIALVMEAEHLCKTMRGVKKQGKMVAARLTGVFKEPATRAEFMQYVNSRM